MPQGFRAVVLALCCFVFPVASWAGDTLRTVVNDAFGPGESFEFSIGYGVLEAGTARMEVRAPVELDGRTVIPIVSTATSGRVWDKIGRAHV